MTIAQDVMLLLLDDTTAVPVAGGVPVKYALAGGVLVELAECGHLVVRETDGRIEPAPGVRAGDPVLDWALGVMAQDKARGARTQLIRLGGQVRDVVVDQLVDAGVLRREAGRVSGWEPRDTWDAGVRERAGRLRGWLGAAVAADAVAGAPLGGDGSFQAGIALLDAAGALGAALSQAADHAVSTDAAAGLAGSAMAGVWATDVARRLVAAVRDCVATAA